jgi:hypothetical protein
MFLIDSPELTSPRSVIVPEYGKWLDRGGNFAKTAASRGETSLQ